MMNATPRSHATSLVARCFEFISYQQSPHERQAGLHQIPRSRPEAHIDTPPLDIRHGQEPRGQRFEIDESLTERAVNAGFIGMQRTVGIDEVDGADAAFEAPQELEYAAGQRLLRAMLARTDYRAHIGVR